MSYIRFQQLCKDCGKDWPASFGVVGRTQIGSQAKECPHCGSKNLGRVEDPALPTFPPKPKRFSFSGVKRKISIDDDIWQSTQQYVKDQMNIMKRHGSDPELSAQEFDDLAYTVAEYPQTIRNLEAMLVKKREKEAKQNADNSGTGAVQQTS